MRWLWGLAFLKALVFVFSFSLIPATKESTASSKISSSIKNALLKFSAVGNAIKRIGSTANQVMLIGAFKAIDITMNYLADLIILANLQPLQAPPSVVQVALADAHFTPRAIYTSALMGLDAAATGDGRIILGTDLLRNCSDREIRSIIGHEVAHVTQNHSTKRMLLCVGMVIGVPLLIAAVSKIAEKGECYTSPSVSKKIRAMREILGKGCDFLIKNPLLLFIAYALICAKVSRTFEKEADMVSAKTVHAADGLIAFLERIKNLPSKQTSYLSWLNPLYIVNQINDLPWLSSHPPIEERIAYLKAFVA